MDDTSGPESKPPPLLAEDVTDSQAVDLAQAYPSHSVAFQIWFFALGAGLVLVALLLQKVQSSGEISAGGNVTEGANQVTDVSSADLRRSTKLKIAGSSSPLPELCFSKRWLGVACPGCGLTRAVVSTAKGNLRQAWQFHPAGPLIFLWAALQIPYRIANLWRMRLRRAPWQLPGATTMVVLLGMICLAQWIARMMNWWG